MSTWQAIPVAFVDGASLAHYFPGGAANIVGLDMVILALLLSAALSLVSHFAILVARRRRALLAHGIAYGFLKVSKAPSADATTGGVSAALEKPASANAGKHRSLAPLEGRKVSHDLLPDTVSEIVQAETWDPACSMIYEGAAVFTEPVEVIDLMVFFSRPLFAQVFAVMAGVYRLTLVLLDSQKIVFAVRLAVGALLEPCGPRLHATSSEGMEGLEGIEPNLPWWDSISSDACFWLHSEDHARHVDIVVVLATFLSAFLVMNRVHARDAVGRGLEAILLLAKLAVVVGVPVVAVITAEINPFRTKAANGAEEDLLRARAVDARSSEAYWSILVFSALLTFESHSALKAALCAQPGEVEVSSSRLDRSEYTFGANRRLAARAISLVAIEFTYTATFAILTYTTHLSHDGSTPLPTFIAANAVQSLVKASGAESQWAVTQLARTLVAFAALSAAALVFPGQQGHSTRAAGLFRFALTGKPRSWDPTTIEAKSPFLSLVINLVVHASWWSLWLPFMWVTGTAVAFVFPFVLWRFSRLAIHRLQIPRRLDDGLRLTPFISRVATALGAVAFGASVANMFGFSAA
jgi:hypothetical protein